MHSRKSSKTIGDWTFEAEFDRILGSTCSNSTTKCTPSDNSANECCEFCRYSQKTINFGHLPDMVYSKNRLTITSTKYQFSIAFNAYDALKEIDFEEACDKFDWTYTTSYMGTILNAAESNLQIEPTNEKIDKQKLSIQEHILFYENVILYEDELNDLGVAWCSVKIRVMPSSFFVLLRYFLRIDGQRFKIRDTRFFYEFGNGYLIREHQWREDTVSDSAAIPVRTTLDPNLLFDLLPQVYYRNDKVFLPQV